jgi:O-antigen ligase
MITSVSDRALPLQTTSRSHAVVVVQVFVIALMVFPSYMIIKAIGGDGYPAILIGYVMLLAWSAATLFGFHNPLNHRYPVRIALWTLWIVSIISYIFINPVILTPLEEAAGDRWFMQLAGVSGVILFTAEFLRTQEDVMRVLRTLSWGGAFCGVVAALQFWLRLDITPYLRWLLPGFSIDESASGNAVIILRGSLNRVFGTAIDPIELGVTAGMLLPLIVYVAMYDTKRPAFERWIPVIFVASAIATSVSRSAVLAVIFSMGVFIVGMQPVQRVKALAAIPFSLAVVFMGSHGLIGTLKSFFEAGTTDSSIAHRVDTYPFVEQTVSKMPWLGQGGGTYIAKTAVYILDNQYLTIAIELGLIGVAALLFFFTWPTLAALVARRRTGDQQLRDLGAALAGASLAAAVCSATFDSLSFPMFVNVQALVLGLIGALWLIVDRSHKAATESPMPSLNHMSSANQRLAGTHVAGSAGGN